MMSTPNESPAYDRTWQVRLLVLTLLFDIVVGSFGTLLSALWLQDLNLGFLGAVILSQISIDIFLAIQLVRRAENVFSWIVIRAVGYILLWGGALIFILDEPLEALVGTYLASGIGLPLLLLAAGTPGRWRKFVALLTLIGYVLFVILVVGMLVLVALYVD